MTSKTFIDKVAERSDISSMSIAKVLDWVELCLKEEITKGDRSVKLMDLTFYPYVQKPRPVRNPKTMESFMLRPDRVLKVKTSLDWKRLFRYYREITQEDFDKIANKYFY